MKKLRQYNVKFKKNATNNLEDIKLTQSLMWDLLECYLDKELDKKEQDIIIKYILPDKDEEDNEEVSSKALKELKEGIHLNNNKYLPFITSPSMMKKSSNRRKCEYLFIKEGYEEFKEIYRDVISIGKKTTLDLIIQSWFI